MRFHILMLVTLLSCCFLKADETAMAKSVAAKISQKEPGSRHFTIEFTNLTEEEITLIRPLDGSLWNWHYPHYDFQVTDQKGNIVERPSRCGISGLWADTEWPTDYLFVIQPGKSMMVAAYLPHHVPKDGEYHVAFRYVWKASEDQASLPASVVIGTIKAEPIRVRIDR